MENQKSWVKLSDIEQLPNVRKTIEKETTAEFVDSIRQNGIITPVLIRVHPDKKGKFQLVAGQRRFKAATELKFDAIPALVRDVPDNDIEELQLLENLQRANVHPYEEAQAYKRIAERAGSPVTPADIAKKVGKTAYYVASRMQLNNLTAEFGKAFHEGRMDLTEALKISKLSIDSQKKLWKDDKLDGKSTDIEFSDWDLKKMHGDLTNPPFDVADPNLVKAMGPCTGCKFNTATNSLLFPELANNPKCTNVPCFEKKCEVGFTARLDAALNDPTMILVTGEWGSLGKFASELVKKGNVVLPQGSNGYSSIDAPDDDWEDNIDRDDYDTDAEYQKELAAEKKKYDKELEEYNKKLNSGKFQKAFVVEGNDRGKIIIVDVKKASKQIAKVAKGKVASGEADADAVDVKAVVAGIKEREKRAKELDYEKVSARVIESINKHEGYKNAKGPLSKDEQIALYFLVANETGYNGFDNLKRKLKLPSNIREWKELKPADIGLIVRTALMHKYAGQFDLQEKSSGSHIIRVIATSLGIDVPALDKEQAEIAKTRALRVEQRIADLNKKVKGGKAKETKEAKPAKKLKGTGSPEFMKKMTLSESLQVICGKGPLMRTEVVKKVWAYIKKHQLQDAREKRFINSDEALKKIFKGEARVDMFQMTKMITNHLS